MKTFAVILLMLLGGGRGVAPAQEPGAAGVRFVVMDVWVNSAAEPLAAYQLEVAANSAAQTAAATNRHVRIVGVEGGEPTAFRSAPYYDPAAMQSERVVLGAFSVAAPDRLPRGHVRIASVHCMVVGPTSPNFVAKLVTAATSDGRSIPVRIEIKERSQQ